MVKGLTMNIAWIDKDENSSENIDIVRATMGNRV